MTLLIAFLLLLVANGAPIVARAVLHDHFVNIPLDGGLNFLDRRRLLGPSKTVRGLLAAVVASAIAAVVFGLPWYIGALFGVYAMAGDMLASFTKRRLAIAPSGMAFGLDQIPEALLPLALLREDLGLSWLDVGLTTLAFLVIEIPLSRLLFRLHIRSRPY